MKYNLNHICLIKDIKMVHQDLKNISWKKVYVDITTEHDSKPLTINQTLLNKNYL